ncbi:hypothetical protein GO986_21760 [Deinococcus sp. HMF7620]|uniref:Uncharacterized protein n=1 Tax=Deinococcus arboris TaxID=2682977 RepID=A0A7C9M9G6_9DEIO|nr:hypothetical protein [Deinococcus arboris]MVN89365.1 hypothetical protein [Deinococcus arboris]
MTTIPAVVVSRRAGKTLRPELVLAPGPLTLGQPGAGSFAELYGGRWALALHRDGPQLYQVQGGAWAPRADSDALGPLASGKVQHVGLAFDQAARPVLAWCLAGQVSVRQWHPQSSHYVTRGPWAGHNPCLIADALSEVGLADSDVLCIHLAPDRLSLTGRAQRELYATAHALGSYPTPAALDQVVALPQRWAALAGTLAGDVAAPRLSGLYPVTGAGHTQATVGQPASGVRLETFQVYTPTTEPMTATVTQPASGARTDTVLASDLAPNPMTATLPAPSSGALTVVVVVVTLPSDNAAAALSAPSGGTLT